MTAHVLEHHGSNGRLTVTRERQGWEILEERDNRVVRRVHCSDWHRVERTIGMFTMGSDAPPAPRHRKNEKN